MNLRSSIAICFLCLTGFFLVRCNDSEPPDDVSGLLQLVSVTAGSYNFSLAATATNQNVPVDIPIIISFSSPIDVEGIQPLIILTDELTGEVPVTISLLENNRKISLMPVGGLKANRNYTLAISNKLRGANGENFPGFEIDFKTLIDPLEITSWSIGGVNVLAVGRILDIPLDPAVVINFSHPLNPETLTSSNIYIDGSTSALTFHLSNENKTVTITPSSLLEQLIRYRIIINDKLKGENGEIFLGLSRDFYTTVDAEPKFPVLSDDQLLTLVQQQTFKYFYDFAHPASGMARERNTSGNTVTSGGSGFGLMAIIVGIERDFITRQQGIEHLDKILNFLETADRFHGAWSHWIDGNTGNVQPFSANDNGGDLVETSFLIQGLITFRQYLNEADQSESELIDRINTLWESVEWDWYTKNENVLYWHWSPDKEWIMNHQIRGYNEALITYVLAASSPSHSINASVYHQGWANNGTIANGKKFYDITLPLGGDFGGPLFFAHYSFLGLDPRNLNDTYANYWTQNVNHSLINHAYSVANPKNYAGYSDESWGLTASDNHQGYSAHSPTNDLGVITPTAALSSFPYTPEQSMKALKFFYYKFGDRLWGEYGFYDAYNPTQGWVADSYLAIDQGPIVVMVENYRTGLLWDLFMSAPEVQSGLNKLSFTY